MRLPDWTRHAKAAPFKRNDQMLETLPIGIVAFRGSGVSANLALRGTGGHGRLPGVGRIRRYRRLQRRLARGLRNSRLNRRCGYFSCENALPITLVFWLRRSSADSRLHQAIYDPPLAPETKAVIEALKAENEHLDHRVTRLEVRLNSLHNSVLALPLRPGPFVVLFTSTRRDLELDLPLANGTN
jgi:hypothetical protein